MTCPRSLLESIFVFGDAATCSSKYMFDQFSLAHFVTGALWRRHSRRSLLQGLVAHTVFEVFENNPTIVKFLSTLGTRYEGDSFVNIVGDTVSFWAGYENDAFVFLVGAVFLLWYTKTFDTPNILRLV